MPLDSSILLQAQVPQIANPMDTLGKAMALGNLATSSQMNQYALKAAQRKDQAIQALGQLLPQLQQSGFSDQSVQAALTHPLVQQNPDVAQSILEVVDARRKAESAAAKDKAVAFKDTAEGKAKMYDMLGNAAGQEWQNPTSQSLPRMNFYANKLGVDMPQFAGNPNDPADLKAYLGSIRSGAYAVKDQMSNAETGRHNLSTEGLTASAQVETAKHDRAQEGIGYGNLGVAKSRLGLEREGLTLKQQEADPFGMLGINPKPPTSGAGAAIGNGMSGDALLQQLPGPIAEQVKALAEGRMAFPSSFALKTPYWQTMLSMVGQYDPSFDAVNYGARAATRKDFVSGKSAQSLNALNTVAGHLDTLATAAKNLNNFGSVATPLNAPVNAIESAFGDERLKQFNIARKTVSDELVRAYRGAGGSEKDIQEWMGLLSANDSPKTQAANLAQVSELLSSKINALGEQYKQGMGQTSQPIQLVTPKAQGVFDKLEAARSGTKPSGGVTVTAPDGKTYSFPSESAALEFKVKAGMQ